jgi:hypothetical protein
MLNSSSIHVAVTMVSELNRAHLLALLALPLPHDCCSALEPEEELVWSKLVYI